MSAREDLVLIVDSDLAVRESLKFLVELEGMRAEICGTARQFLDHPDLDKARCAIIDSKLPDMAVAEILDRLRTQQNGLNAILIADQMSRSALLRMKAAGARYIVEKPVLDDALLECLRKVRSAEPLPVPQANEMSNR